MDSVDATRSFIALVQEARLNLMRTLAVAGPSRLAAEEFAAKLDQPHSTLSFHLSALEEMGLVQSTRQGRHVIGAQA